MAPGEPDGLVGLEPTARRRRIGVEDPPDETDRAVGKRFRGCRAQEKNTKAAGRRRRAAAVAGRGRRPPPQGGHG